MSAHSTRSALVRSVSETESTADGEEHELQPISAAASRATENDADLTPSSPLLSSNRSSVTSKSSSAASISIVPEAEGWWRKTERGWRNSWIAEFLCCALVGGSLLAICIVLWRAQGKPRPQWPIGISVNALIAVFMVLLKGGISLPVSEGISELKWQSMRSGPRRLLDMQDYDSASRGAWGSLQFLVKLDVAGFDSSSITWYKPETWKPILQLLKIQRGSFTRYFAKVAAFITVLSFIADPFAQQLVEYVDCLIESPSMPASLARTNIHARTGGHVHTTENVFLPELDLAIIVGSTFPPKNVHSLVTSDCPSGNCTFPTFQTLGMCSSCHDITNRIRSERESGTEDLESCCYNYTLVDRSTNDTYLWANDRYIVLNTTTSGRSVDDTFRMTVLRGQHHPAAYSCELYPCVKEYNSSIKNAVLTENVLNTTRIPWSGLRPGDFSLSTNRTLRNGMWEDCQKGPANETIPNDCFWNFSAMDDLAEHLGEALGNQYMMMATTSLYGSTVARNIWNNQSLSITSLSDYMEKLAEVLTATIRNTGNRNASSTEYPLPLQGVARVEETCIEVRWKWLSFLAVMSGFTMIFWTTFYIYHRTTSRHPIWKSSDLAVLFCSLDDQVKENIKSCPERDEMFEMSKKTVVQLLTDIHGKATFEKQ